MSKLQQLRSKMAELETLAQLKRDELNEIENDLETLETEYDELLDEGEEEDDE